MKKKNKLISLSIVIGSMLSSCVTNSTSAEPNMFSVWSTYATTKVLQNQSSKMTYQKQGKEISIDMMRGESESSQLIITAERDIDCFTLVKTDLSDGFGNILPKEDISIFVQKYITLKRKFNSNNQSIVAGDKIPDMLLPLNKSIEYHENFINKGENQGITIDIKTYGDTVAGLYKGNFKLYLDDEVVDIPVSVNVWDIDGSGKHDFKSCFLVYQNYLTAGEFCNSDELLKNYDEFLLDYQVCFENITNEDKSDEGIDKYMDYCMSFLSRDEYNSINIPLWFDFDGDGYDFDTAVSSATAAGRSELDAMYRYFKSMISKTTEENKLIDYCYWYASCLDEADAYPDTLLVKAIKFFKQDGDWQKSLDYVINKLQLEGAFDSFSSSYKEHVIDYLEHFPAVYTNTLFGSSIDNDLCATLCPLLSIFDSESNVAELAAYSNKNTNGNLWAYTCSGPVNPYPTLHIDDYNLGSRVAGWMFKKYDIKGYLYWAVDLYQSLKVFGSLDTVTDPYSDVERAGRVPGDGFLLYPGKYYGSEYPFASNRLVTYRDSVEDYVLLSRYEQALEKYASRYGISVEPSDYIIDLYNSLFTGSVYINDDSLVFNARKELARRILALENDDHILCVKDVKNSCVDLTLYSSSSSLTINGANYYGTSHNGGYVYSLPNQNGNVSIESQQYIYTLSLGERGIVVDFDNPSSVRYNLSDSSTINIANGKATIELVSMFRNNNNKFDSATKVYRPSIDFEASFKGLKTIKFNVKNLSQENKLNARIELVDSYGTKTEISNIFVAKNSENMFVVNLNSVSETVLENAVKFRISVTNYYADELGINHLSPNAKFEMSSVTFEK